MITLSDQFQYVGRSNRVPAFGYGFDYYVLLYAKAEPNVYDDGSRTVTVKMRLVNNGRTTFHGYLTDGWVKVEGQSAISWTSQYNPNEPWDASGPLTEGGVTYNNWVDLAEGTADVEVGLDSTDITIDLYWQRLNIIGNPPSHVARITKANGSFMVTLPEVTPVEPEAPQEDPEDAVLIYADDDLVYDSRLEKYDLEGLKVTGGVNVGGTAEIMMPPTHPAYDRFVEFRTVVTIYRNGLLRFRGRARYATDDIYFRRTITCEGERCFLRDGAIRPKTYKSTPAKIFRAAIREYNAWVDDFKKFTIGSVTIPDRELELQVSTSENALQVIEKLQNECGGQIVFTQAAGGRRAIHWLDSMERMTGQVIEFGENLLQFTSAGKAADDLTTILIPYGANDKETNEPLTIASVNGGVDYLVAEDAKNLRGVLVTSYTWNEIEDPEELLEEAMTYLNTKKNFITSLELTALDLSYIDKSLSAFSPGDLVRVISAPHGVDADFQISSITEDLLNPAQSTITLGKEIQSLTGASVAENRKTHREVESIGGALDPVSIAASVERSVLDKTAGAYASHDEVTKLSQADTDLLTAISNEVNTRAGIINKVNGTVIISGGAPIDILGGKININGSEINCLKELRFLNESGIRIANKDGTSYYVLRVDASNNCFVGNDYTNLYLRGKDAVYLHKTGAVVTSDRRHKNGIEELPAAYEAILDKLTPVRFRYNDRGDQYHVGFVAQDVDTALTEAGLTRKDFGGFVDVSGDGANLGLAYDEFIGLLLQKVQRLEKRITELEGKA